ncbi:Uma2 family endonuclease [Thermosynechococcus sp. QKsg1]|uniref:Uma2 family endonuclease n=1 Tax=unclassified Thermosynechococcus TaxID=2622553 RepID=UPI00122DCD0D|nr:MULTISPECIES: Uma2 family endonuclease [unclassified Thermosynechococcus]MDR5639397.1 Uma2 family endonuclease [Thermosynechococcus sp. PP42]QEQ00449.1 Uma2 family endonuclease [Thermosynechococcus sp. CL-1]WJI24673.1 Uma2 family endonuclease [Thermosynechococcus sp. B0]WJI27192.1 Uma2 family endonuclease [Thermosynechococcus sp. B1]WJI29721.1 Uma2 family endonuclease [Thermosynechococcus sp. B3]
MVTAKETGDRYFTPEEYFAWEEQQLEKHELIDGRVYAMAGGSKNHSIIKLNFGNLIKPHLRGRGCQVFNSDLRVNILHTTNFTYPDLSVTCDDRDRQSPFFITYPCLIVEVLSPATEAYDRGKKFDLYRRNPNLVDYVLASSEEMAIDIYQKNEVGDWLLRCYRAGDRVELRSIDLKVPIEQFYEDVDLSAPAVDTTAP